MSNPTQAEEVYAYMKSHDFINQSIATAELGCSRLAAIILKLKKAGIEIDSKLIYFKKKNGRTGRFANYSLRYKANDATGN